MKHGVERYFFKGTGWIVGSLIPLVVLKSIFAKYAPFHPTPKPDPIDPGLDDPLAKPRRTFCRLFGEGAQPDADGLVELGMAMETEQMGNIASAGDSDIPAGYTYLGQFVDHDITADPIPLSATGAVDPREIMNQRTPSLDLDSVYGNGPALNSELFEDDGVHLKIGRTSPTLVGEPGGPIDGNFPNDLPRREDKKAIIGDGRNDENLAVAQTHLAFLKFHNKKVDEIAAANSGLRGNDLFQAAKAEVIRLYQAIVLSDFLPHFIEAEVLADVMENGRKFYGDDLKDCMPIEFSVGAYRMGHSMVRPAYEWNRVFRTGGVDATMELLFEFSAVSGSRGPGDDPFFGKPTVPSNWIIDWRRFYDFANVDGIDSHPDMNFAREIDTKLSFALRELPEFQNSSIPPVSISLATRNLLRGRLVKLPTGQEVARAMLAAGINFTAITDEEVADAPHREILIRHGFDGATPLWYYVLREAKVRHDGNRLGPVGSRIVAEVFVGLIENSPISILNSDPDLKFSMAEMLAFVDDLNPLGD